MTDPGTPDIGALSRITPSQVAGATALVRTGTVHDLGLPLDERMPQSDAFTPFSFTWRVTPEGSAPDGHYQYAAETITGALHAGTHIDGLVHVAAAGRVYGNRRASDVRTDRGFTAHGIETVPPILTRGVVLDIASLHGVPALEDGYEITRDDLARALDRAGITVGTGDAVLVRTGKVREYGTDNTSYQSGQPGVGPEGAIWLYEQGMAVLGTDTTGTEPLPFPDEHHTTHQEMLVERGVHLIENLSLDGVAAHGVTHGLFVCLPLRITGATGSWVRPVLVT